MARLLTVMAHFMATLLVVPMTHRQSGMPPRRRIQHTFVGACGGWPSAAAMMIVLLIAVMVASVRAASSKNFYPEFQVPRQSWQPHLRSDGTIASVPAVLNYLDPTVSVAHVRRDVIGRDEGGIDSTPWRPKTVSIRNGRHQDLQLHRNGFELRTDPLAQPVDDFRDPQHVVTDYYPQCESLLRKVLGPKVHVQAFDHNVRGSPTLSNPDLEEEASVAPLPPAGVVHNDYTAVSAPRRLEQLTQPPRSNDVLQHQIRLDIGAVQAALAGRRRFALVNVWRSIDQHHPVVSHPLACADAQSVRFSDLRLLQIHYVDRVGENYLAADPGPSDTAGHDWYFFPDMTHGEALLIKQWDSWGSLAQGSGDGETREEVANLSTFALHSAFALGEANATPRQSIEVRCICIWDEDR